MIQNKADHYSFYPIAEDPLEAKAVWDIMQLVGPIKSRAVQPEFKDLRAPMHEIVPVVPTVAERRLKLVEPARGTGQLAVERVLQGAYKNVANF